MFLETSFDEPELRLCSLFRSYGPIHIRSKLVFDMLYHFS